MRLRQKNKWARCWARRGTRLRAPHDQRTKGADLVTAIYLELGTGAASVLSACNTTVMQIHLEEISKAVAPNAHADLILDRTGWHISEKL